MDENLIVRWDHETESWQLWHFSEAPEKYRTPQFEYTKATRLAEAERQRELLREEIRKAWVPLEAERDTIAARAAALEAALHEVLAEVPRAKTRARELLGGAQ